MHSPTSSEEVRIVVPCAQTRLPGPRGHRDAFSSSTSEKKSKHKARFEPTTIPHARAPTTTPPLLSLLPIIIPPLSFRQTLETNALTIGNLSPNPLAPPPLS